MPDTDINIVNSILVVLKQNGLPTPDTILDRRDIALYIQEIAALIKARELSSEESYRECIASLDELYRGIEKRSKQVSKSFTTIGKKNLPERKEFDPIRKEFYALAFQLLEAFNDILNKITDIENKIDF